MVVGGGLLCFMVVNLCSVVDGGDL